MEHDAPWIRQMKSPFKGLHLILGTDPEQREQWELCVVVPGLVPVK